MTTVAELCHWVERHEHAREVPDHLYAPAERENKARRFEPMDRVEAEMETDFRDELLGKHSCWMVRRFAERSIGTYCEVNHMYPDLVDKMRTCRMSGTYGYQPSDANPKVIVAWDRKCGLTRLCPDEAREEQQRIAERYAPPAVKWQRDKRRRQIQYCVLTWPNVAPTALARFKRLMAKHVAAWLKSKVCASVKGALVTQEDPLAADGDWNVHTNLLLLVEGKFDWSAARKDWHKRTRELFDTEHRDFQVHFVDVTGGDIERTIRELCKYSVKHISAKADGTLDHQATLLRPASDAPPLTDWPPERFIEWWKAGKNFRRTRSYGVLYKVPPPDKHSFQGVVWQGRINCNLDAGRY